MNKLEFENINFDNNDYLVEIKGDIQNIGSNSYLDKETAQFQRQDDEIEKVNEKELEILQNAQKQAELIINNAKEEAKTIIEEANQKKDELIEQANKEIQDLKQTTQDEIETRKKALEEENENIRIERAKEGYEEGHKDGLEKIKEEMEQKLEYFDDFIKKQFEIKESVKKACAKEVLTIIENIARKVILKEIDAKILEKIINNTISKLEKKENIKITVSENYAKLLYSIENGEPEGTLEDIDLKSFNRFKNFEVIYNSKFSDDTIIVETDEETLEASINSQLDYVFQDIYENIGRSGLDFEEFEDAQKDKIQESKVQENDT